MNDLTGAAVIVDLVRSRHHPDRALAQQRIVDALDSVGERIPALLPLQPTVGDEFQGMYGSIHDALTATLLIRLSLPDDLDCRFGIGIGESRDISDGPTPIRDGSAWWSARAAIGEAQRRENDDEPWLRTWIDVDPGHTHLADAAITNAYLICRDQLLSSQTPNSRRALLGHLLGETQHETAAALGVSQPAVSRALAKGSATAITASTHLIRENTP
ncbi:hypothetical protein M2152_001517 [Microbacteriaceae bacterium SG_E_30_P1]|uniref:SatD family protein n=1 Tax=Antiquaquibacter oligotrophicus TaxID=2880260 RepID=A0ABT6KMV1_9MICO|nr:SatD family protein [Antiquaquibacter oligotrophicus]MDH6181335.1 hypothetical protein [Antiquaquibacter oligotrophicus]UDF12972.1 SatD family protein [Antiquaquibacter oligotrophicus]